MNRIKKVTLELVQDDLWHIEVTKEFAPQFGGGEQTFGGNALGLGEAMDLAKRMTTAAPGQRTDLPTCEECGHPLRDHTPVCEANRSTYPGGVQVDGPCGCKAALELNPTPPYVASR